MKKLTFLIFLLLHVSLASAQGESAVIVFEHANVIDGVSSKPLLDVSVVVANGKIAAIGKHVRAPANAQIIDLSGKWLLPGYIDAHVHFNDFEWARRALRFGVTTARTMGIDHFIDIEIRDAHKKGRSDLPEVLAGGYQVRPDVFDAFPSFIKDFPELADMKPRVAGTANVRRLVKALASRGVDHIKLLASERAGTPDTDPRKRTFTDEEIAAIVDEATKARLKVTAHAHVDEAAAAAVRAGVSSIEHGTWLSDKTLRLMKSRGTWFVSNIFNAPTVAYLHSIFPLNPVLVERRRTMWPLAAEVTKRAYKMGVPVVAATDITYGSQFDSGQATIADNAAGLAEIGVPKMEAIKAITSKAAKLLEIDRRTGAIRRGLEADMVVLGADPLSSIEALKNIRMIINDGRVVYSRTDQGVGGSR
jgi:imidazolonepropionase-like amidohydrolase